ncbi:hypothetical protein ACQPW3_15485 [Actinosynnema sp. CA-248983]
MTEEELAFVAWVSRVNQDLGRYVVRLVDEANPLCTTEYTTQLVEIENQLAADLAEAAHAVAARRYALPRQIRGPAERTLPAARPGIVIDQPSELARGRVTR